MEDLLASIDPGSPESLDERFVALTDDELEDVTARLHRMARALDATIHHAVGVLERREIPEGGPDRDTGDPPGTRPPGRRLRVERVRPARTVV